MAADTPGRAPPRRKPMPALRFPRDPSRPATRSRRHGEGRGRDGHAQQPGDALRLVPSASGAGRTRVPGLAEGRCRTDTRGAMSGSHTVVLAATAASLLILPACLGGQEHAATAPSTSREAGPTSTKLGRPVHFPRVVHGSCPASRGRYVTTPTVKGIALGNGPVRVFINNAGDLRQGRAHLASTRFPNWLALKTHFFSSPDYQEAFLVRTKRLDRGGPIALGARPTDATSVLVPSGPAANGQEGWREFPYSTFVKSPGCYAWQVDGLTFSEIIVVRMLGKFNT
jgi:hypothetical protein